MKYALLPARLAATIAAATSAAAVAAPAATELRLRTRFVHSQVAPTHGLLVELLNGLLRIRVSGHFDKREPARTACGVVTDNVHSVNGTSLAEQVSKFVFGGGVGEITDVQFATHDRLLRQDDPCGPGASSG
jgi:hypothetical protein